MQKTTGQAEKQNYPYRDIEITTKMNTCRSVWFSGYSVGLQCYRWQVHTKDITSLDLCMHLCGCSHQDNRQSRFQITFHLNSIKQKSCYKNVLSVLNTLTFPAVPFIQSYDLSVVKSILFFSHFVHPERFRIHAHPDLFVKTEICIIQCDIRIRHEIPEVPLKFSGE